MRIFLSLILAVSLLSVAAILSEASTNLSKPMPCDGDFELQMSIAPTNTNHQNEIGLSLNIAKDAKQGTAMRTHTSQSSTFDKLACEKWQKKYWYNLEMALNENSNMSRKNVECLNVASVEYRIANHKTKTKLCLNRASKDDLTFIFKRFYEGTDLFINR